MGRSSNLNKSSRSVQKTRGALFGSGEIKKQVASVLLKIKALQDKAIKSGSVSAKPWEEVIDREIIENKDLSAINFSESTWQEGKLNHVTFKNSDDKLDSILNDATFNEIELENVTFPCQMSNVLFSKSALKNSSLAGSDLDRARFLDSSFFEVDFSKASMKDVFFDSSTDSFKSKFHETEFSESVSFAGAKLIATSFEKTKLEKADFSGSNIAKSEFSQTNLESVNFTGADIRQALFKGDKEDMIIKNPDFSKSKLGLSLFLYTRIENPNFKEANLYGLKIMDSHLLNADLRDHDLTLFRGRNAIFENVDFRNSILKSAQFHGCEFINCSFPSDTNDVKFVNCKSGGSKKEPTLSSPMGIIGIP